MSQRDTSSDLAYQSTQLNEFRFFYKPPNDDKVYHVTCKMVYQNSENLTLLDDDYDYEFFYQGYHITCKLISDELIVDILNKEIYGINFDANGLRRRHLLIPYQKLNLEQNLKQDILFYLCMRSSN